MLALLVVSTCLGALIALPPVASAEVRGVLEKLETLSQELQLTPQQKGEILPVLRVEVPKIEAVKKNSSMTKLQKVRELREIHRETAPQMQKILSPAQYQKLQKVREEEIRRVAEKKLRGA